MNFLFEGIGVMFLMEDDIIFICLFVLGVFVVCSKKILVGDKIVGVG